MNQGKAESVRDEEVERAEQRLAKQRLDDLRTVIATVEGRRLLHWVVYEVGRLQAVVPDEPQGRRALAIAVHNEVDLASPGSAAKIALEARMKRISDNADIQSAIENRSDEYA